MKKVLNSGKFVLLGCFLLFLSCKSTTERTPSILEVVDTRSFIPKEEIITFCSEYQIDSHSIYCWKNHWLIYANPHAINKLKEAIEEQYPDSEINLYEKPFYCFSREEHCNDKPVRSWDHVIMTANLVEDEAMQQAYMEYHRTQFEKWPEVAKGFCNADFQQVLVFRNGRQLMLVISIPKGKSLEELNPKTVEHNPRVEEWNAIMNNYQEGLADAPNGSTWITFEKITEE
ncbi:L-rhamnose mutarotase [Anaerorudis cellulosivorans]|uniref:L-rhamnose mutarotase n=1 Tax=Anaerorudis cellulosivorans TaxID=3397862 RepID=UPI002220F045|nr:L-rhamnose mutarotase [Seramator thermalis]MCW1735835.1 L-rhamnose mutarotase [Seramator thermalis]